MSSEDLVMMGRLEGEASEMCYGIESILILDNLVALRNSAV